MQNGCIGILWDFIHRCQFHLRISSRQFFSTADHVCVKIVIVVVMITGGDRYVNVFHVWNRSFDSHGRMCLDVDRNGPIDGNLHRIRHFFLDWYVVESLHWIWGWNGNFHPNRQKLFHLNWHGFHCIELVHPRTLRIVWGIFSLFSRGIRSEMFFVFFTYFHWHGPINWHMNWNWHFLR